MLMSPEGLVDMTLSQLSLPAKMVVRKLQRLVAHRQHDAEYQEPVVHADQIELPTVGSVVTWQNFRTGHTDVGRIVMTDIRVWITSPTLCGLLVSAASQYVNGQNGKEPNEALLQRLIRCLKDMVEAREYFRVEYANVDAWASVRIVQDRLRALLLIRGAATIPTGHMKQAVDHITQAVFPY